MKTRQDICEFISRQPHVVGPLTALAALGLPDAWIGAGLIRCAVWDELHGFEGRHTEMNDVDVVYFDAADATVERDLSIEAQLRSAMPEVPWEVRNQARMHTRNGDARYHDTEDALRYWAETATAIAARLKEGSIELIAPHGIDDLVGLIVRPTPVFTRKPDAYRKRRAAKDWGQRWPGLTFVDAKVMNS